MERVIRKGDVLCKCRYCNGYFPLDVNVGLYDNELDVPKVLAPTIEDLERLYQEIEGSSYEENTGNKMKDNFVIGMREILHTEEGEDEEGLHSLGKFECWCEII